MTLPADDASGAIVLPAEGHAPLVECVIKGGIFRAASMIVLTLGGAALQDRMKERLQEPLA